MSHSTILRMRAYNIMNTGRTPDADTVYSTEHGRMCPCCGKSVAQCGCRRTAKAAENFQPHTQSPPPNDGVVRIGLATKGRKGKGVTIITGLSLNHVALQKLAKQLKQQCGAGGTVKKGTIEVQGDHRDRLIEALQQLGYTVKRAGG